MTQNLTQAEVLDRTRNFVKDNFLYMRPEFQLADDESLMARGVVDSMGVAEMLEFLEAEFGTVIEDHEITEENLGTLARIAAFVSTKGVGQRA